MKTLLLSLLAVGVLSTSGTAAERGDVNVQRLLKLTRDAATAAETLRISGTQIPKPLSIRRPILVLTERIARTARDLARVSSGERGSAEFDRQQCWQRAAKMMEDTENLVEAIRSLRNSAEAAHDARGIQEARRMVSVVWGLRVTVQKLRRELGDPGVTRTARTAM